jgi:hypothetical protein
MKQWRINCPYIFQVVIEQSQYLAMPRLNDIDEQEVFEKAKKRKELTPYKLMDMEI